MAESGFGKVAGIQAVSEGGTPKCLLLRMGSRKLGMLLFVLSDGLTFAALLTGYLYLRGAGGHWPEPFHLYPHVTFSAGMTLVLLLSAATMASSISAAKRGGRKTARRWLVTTALLGLTFILMRLKEWDALLLAGLFPNASGWGEPLLGAAFYVTTALHTLHVGAGVLYVGILAARVNRISDEAVEACGLYWYFVGLVWLFIFALIYLLSANFRGE